MHDTSKRIPMPQTTKYNFTKENKFFTVSRFGVFHYLPQGREINIIRWILYYKSICGWFDTEFASFLIFPGSRLLSPQLLFLFIIGDTVSSVFKVRDSS